MSKMIDEIRQQPAALERTLASSLPAAEQLRAHFASHRPRFIILAARGTSDNAAQFGRYLFEATVGIPVSLAAPSIFTVYGARMDLRDVLVVGISQSGESTDTNFVLEQAREMGAYTVGITNEKSSSMAKLAHATLLVEAGRETSVAATKTYTGQLLQFYLLAYALGGRIRPEALRRVPEWTQAALQSEAETAECALRYCYMERTVVIGRGFHYSSALEFGLKMMETCQVVADRFSGADFLHGPIAMVEPGFPVFVFAPGGPTLESTESVLERLQKLGANILLLTDRSQKERLKGYGRLLTARLPASATRVEPSDLYTPIPYIIPAQIFAGSLAAHKGLDPDAPRGLKKVTLTM